ncbi:replication initiation protein (plasmid) [Flammeovirga sp. MY04]|uniref:replication initiation protein n=1 Tax=Flammeovirga sp. MY04 TaxID=1191459 RepID=UPI0008062639|nr:replication initiation protein [Flammeovirga sp. MY04]ANQ52914.1 replication initiation protein [Flammeovirga sp. MY04]
MKSIFSKVMVKRHNGLVRAHQKTSLNLTAQKLLLYAFTLKDQDLDKVLEFPVSQFLGRKPGGKDIKNIDNACDQLTSAKIKEGSGVTMEDYESDDFNRKYITLFETIELNKTRVAFKFNRSFKKFLGPSKNFTQYLYSNLKDMKSPHAVRLYDFLIGGVGKYDERKVALNELKAVLGVEDKKSYNNYSTFKNSVLELAVNSINETSDINLSYQALRMMGRKYTHIHFMFSKKTIEPQLNLSKEQRLSPENKLKVEAMRSMGLSNAIINSTIEELLVQQNGNCIDITPMPEAKAKPQPQQQDLFNQEPTMSPKEIEFQEKISKLAVRLKELGITQAVIKKAQNRYSQNPKWGIWKEINDTKMAIRDSQNFPNKHTLKKFIEEE